MLLEGWRCGGGVEPAASTMVSVGRRLTVRVFRRVVLPIAFLGLARVDQEEQACSASRSRRPTPAGPWRSGQNVTFDAGDVAGVGGRRPPRRRRRRGSTRWTSPCATAPGRIAPPGTARDPERLKRPRRARQIPRPDLTVSVSVADAIWAPCRDEVLGVELEERPPLPLGVAAPPRDRAAGRRSWCWRRRHS